MNSLYDESSFLEHHGIKGQKWGVRRFQNPDGTLTAAGKRRYLLKVNEHVVTVVNGYYYDTWNSGNEIVLYYWKRR